MTNPLDQEDGKTIDASQPSNGIEYTSLQNKYPEVT